MLKYLKLALLFIMSFVVITISYTQEICDNSIDDDNDGLIDLNDFDCSCQKGTILSTSFQDTLCCPNSPSQMNCVRNWIQASEATSDYYNICGFMQGQESPSPPSINNYHDGFIGFLNGSTYSNNYKEYIGICLTNSLETNREYYLEFLLGFGLPHLESIYSSFSPINIVIYGNGNCDALPINGFNCPLEVPSSSWIELGTSESNGVNEWKKVRIPFIPSFTVNSIIIGPDCNPMQNNNPGNYYFLDDISITEMDYSYEPAVIEGVPCIESITIEIDEIQGGNYQWYLNGIAISGANSFQYQIPFGENNEGIYQCRIISNGNCILSKVYKHYLDDFPIAELREDTIVCGGSEILLGSYCFGDEYIWNTEDTTRTIIVDTPGTYSVTVSNLCGENYDEIIIEECESCIVEFPNAFTPDNDDINDYFEPLSNCPISNFELRIFNRWGELVYKTKEISYSWSGTTLNDVELPSDVYLWKASFSIFQNGELKEYLKSGDITLLR